MRSRRDSYRSIQPSVQLVCHCLTSHTRGRIVPASLSGQQWSCCCLDVAKDQEANRSGADLENEIRPVRIARPFNEPIAAIGSNLPSSPCPTPFNAVHAALASGSSGFLGSCRRALPWRLGRGPRSTMSVWSPASSPEAARLRLGLSIGLVFDWRIPCSQHDIAGLGPA